MSNNLGIFLNNTDSEIKYNINVINYNNLKSNFDNIIVIDINNNYSEKLNNYIKNDEDFVKIINYEMDNKNLKNNYDDFDSNQIFRLIDSSNYFDHLSYNYITFINDNYIYCSDLKDYFDYVNNHNLDFYSYTDSTEKKYHFQLYLFTINSKSLYKLVDLINSNNNELLFNIHNIFDKKMPYLKIAYLKSNIESNIFFNTKDDIYKNLVENGLCPIININRLHFIKNNFQDVIHYETPKDFDINIYRNNDDLNHLNDEAISKHFIHHGQYEFRLYKKNNNIYPEYIRYFLKKYNLLNYFDIPDDFDIVKYRDNNEDLKGFTIKRIILHWVNYGSNEGRSYK